MKHPDNSLFVIMMGEFPDLNSHIGATNAHRLAGSKLKKQFTDLAHWYFRNKPNLEDRQYHVTFHWFTRDRRKDPDNIAFAKKYILDGAVAAGILKNDGWRQIGKFTDEFSVDKKNPRVSIIFTPIEKP